MHMEDVRRKVNAREIARQAGRHPHTPVILYGQVAGGFEELEIAAMPIDASENSSLVNDLGALYFMSGYSAVGSADPIAPAI